MQVKAATCQSLLTAASAAGTTNRPDDQTVM